MLKLSRMWFFPAMIAAGLVISSPVKAEVAGCKAARSFVTGVSGKVAKIMSVKTGRERKFAQVFKRYSDMAKMAKFALGRYARSLPKSMKREYYRLAEKMVVKIFTNNMGPYKGRSYRIWNCKPKGRGYTVGGAIMEKNGNIIIDVHWLLMPYDGRLKMRDISVAHVWLAQQQRSNYVSLLSKNRGDFKALLAHMRRQTGGRA